MRGCREFIVNFIMNVLKSNHRKVKLAVHYSTCAIKFLLDPNCFWIFPKYFLECLYIYKLYIFTSDLFQSLFDFKKPLK